MRKSYVLILLFVVPLLHSCKKEQLNKSKESVAQPTAIPYASQEELEKFNGCDDVIHYKVARYYAYEEIENSLYAPLKIQQGQYRLTDRPVIVYDFDSKPKYYEFGVLSI